MKKMMMCFILGVLLIGLVVAVQGDGNSVVNPPQINAGDEENNEQNQQQNQNQQQVENQGQVKAQLKFQEREVECNDCEVEEETDENGEKKFKMKLSNGNDAEIKVMPETASQTALTRLRLKVCSEESNCSIELKEVGKGDDTKPAYELQAQRHFRILGLFRTKAQVKAQVDAETGKIVSVKKPWWAFLAYEGEE